MGFLFIIDIICNSGTNFVVMINNSVIAFISASCLIIYEFKNAL